MRTDIILLGVFCFACGAFAMWLWCCSDISHYRELYKKVLDEKKAQQVEFNNRLDALGKAMEVDTSFLSFGMMDLASGDTGPSTASEEVVDEEYR